MKQEELDRYDEIKKKGYVIDTRGPLSVLMLGMVTWRFNTFAEALAFAEGRLSKDA